MTCAQGLLRLLWGGPEVGVLRHCSLLESRGFKLRKWVANTSSKAVLSGIPKCDLGSNIRDIDLSAESTPDSKALGLVWNVVRWRSG